MKLTIAVLACCLAVTLAQESRELTQQYFTRCKKELNIADADSTPDKPVPCNFLECMLKKQGHMKADGTWDVDKAVNLQPKFVNRTDFRRTLEARHTMCTKKHPKGDTCNMAKCMSGQE